MFALFICLGNCDVFRKSLVKKTRKQQYFYSFSYVLFCVRYKVVISNNLCICCAFCPFHSLIFTSMSILCQDQKSIFPVNFYVLCVHRVSVSFQCLLIDQSRMKVKWEIIRITEFRRFDKNQFPKYQTGTVNLSKLCDVERRISQIIYEFNCSSTFLFNLDRIMKPGSQSFLNNYQYFKSFSRSIFSKTFHLIMISSS